MPGALGLGLVEAERWAIGWTIRMPAPFEVSG
ncbi:hypothetical protein ABIB54_003545 [Frigoribacterium sp. UYMn621]